MSKHTYDIAIYFDDTRLTQSVEVETMVEAVFHAAGLIDRHKAATEARRLHIERRGA